jgi:hypothetical protein
MSRLAVVLDMVVRNGIWFGTGDVDWAGMHHCSRMDTGESTAVEHLDLAATAFFGRRAEHRQRNAEIVDVRGDRHGGTGGNGRDDVVSARVPEAR